MNAQAGEILEDGNIFLHTNYVRALIGWLTLNFFLGALELFLGAEGIDFEEGCLHYECFIKEALFTFIQCILNDYNCNFSGPPPGMGRR